MKTLKTIAIALLISASITSCTTPATETTSPTCDSLACDSVDVCADSTATPDSAVTVTADSTAK